MGADALFRAGGSWAKRGIDGIGGSGRPSGWPIRDRDRTSSAGVCSRAGAVLRGRAGAATGRADRRTLYRRAWPTLRRGPQRLEGPLGSSTSRTPGRAGYGRSPRGAALTEGVYALLGGPHYETWAEAGWLRRIGADLVGMSTVYEAIAAREWGVELAGLSTVTAIEGQASSRDRPRRGGGGRGADGEESSARSWYDWSSGDSTRGEQMSTDTAAPDPRQRQPPSGARSRPTASTSSTRASARAARPGCSGRGAPPTSRSSRCRTARSCSASASA